MRIEMGRSLSVRRSLHRLRSASPGAAILAVLAVFLAVDTSVALEGEGSLLLAPGNDLCGSAVPLFLNMPVNGTTVDAANDYQLSGAACFTGVGQTASTAAGRDVVYGFQAPLAGEYSFRVTGYTTPGNLVLYVASDCPTGTPPITVATCLGGANRSSSGTAEEVMCLPLAMGQVVYVYVDAAAVTAGNLFTLEVNRCARESESNGTPSLASTLACPVEGSISPGTDADFYSLGVPANGSRVFAIADGIAANSSDFDLRVTTSTDTREYDDADNDASFGSLAPNVAGTPLTGVQSFLRINHRTLVVAEPYRLYSAIQPSLAMATVETEPNGTSAQANFAANNYFGGTLAGPSDVDLFRFTAASGDLIVLGFDGDPLRNNSPTNAALALVDGAGNILVSVNDPNSVSNPSPGTGSLMATTPNSPGEGLVYRVRTPGTYYARVTGPGGDYLLSISINCKTFPATDLALIKTRPSACVAAGGSITYTLTVINNGPALARNTILTDSLPANVTFVSATPSQGTCSSAAATVTCHLGDVGSTATVTLVVTASDALASTNTARVESDTVDTNPGNNAAAATTNGACDDGNACTTNDACSGGTCVGGAPLDCNDGNPCTNDSCSPPTGCAHANNTAPCNDGNACTTNDTCSGGMCVGGPPPSCDDGNVCTDDSCAPSTGCAHMNNNLPCSDGNACTANDACSGGTCIGGPPPSCDDGNPCTDDSCVPSAGCTHANNTAPCDDGNTCSTGDMCCEGTCWGGACGGTCTAAGMECVQGLFNECICVPASTPCGSTGQSCEGACPPSMLCAFDATQGCHCQSPASLPPCGSAAAPECSGTCAEGEYCQSDGDPDTPMCVCLSLGIPCEGGLPPACGGECPEGYTCNSTPTGCVCVPGDPSCGAATAAHCGGWCPEFHYCRPDASGAACSCAPMGLPCDLATPPDCKGLCTEAEGCGGGFRVCVPSATGGVCICQSVPCGQSPYPACGGACPSGETCRVDQVLGTCECQPDQIPCGQASAPDCGGSCPSGQDCNPDPTGAFCQCAPSHVPCGQAQAPACDGDCPGGDVCVVDATSQLCVCAPPVMDCGQRTAPACDGNCPPDQQCKPRILGPGCECRPIPPPCAAASPPVCYGNCPGGSQCSHDPAANLCKCVGCDAAAPSSDITILWGSRTHFEWSELECALAYNVYRKTAQRLSDADHDGVADDYGSCFLGGSMSAEANDTSSPPPGFLDLYLVTGENTMGEGSMGFTSTLHVRPNATPCP